jgi:putative transcriptional regulator
LFLANYSSGDGYGVKNKLKDIRHELKIDTQKEFSKLLDIDYTQYNRYETQTDQPSLKIALSISAKLKRPVNEIFYIDDSSG